MKKIYEDRGLLLIGRCIAGGALVGLLIGVLEGLSRYWTPDPPILLHPDVSYAIWFLAPLVDALAGAGLGLLAGLLAAAFSHRLGRRIALAIGAVLAVLLVFLVIRQGPSALLAALGFYPVSFKVAVRTGELLVALAAFMAGRLLSLRTLTTFVGVAFAVVLLGIGVYELRPSMHQQADATSIPAPADRPNVILITLDTLRADHLSSYGYARQTTPNLDGWARRGVVFDNAIASSSWTLPSHASIFTGLLPHQHGADAITPLDPSWWTIGELLTTQGYQTAGFTSNLNYGGDDWGMGNGLQLYDDDSESLRHNLKNLLIGSVYLPRLYKRFVEPDDFDRRNAQQINRDVLRWFRHRPPRPYYLFINYFDVHEPYLAPAPYSSRFGSVSLWEIGRLVTRFQTEEYQSHFTARENAALVTGYDNCLAYLDHQVGALLDVLSHSPGWANTIVIITSDHGEGFGEHGTYSHGHNLYREALRVPLIIVGPGIPAGRRISPLVGIRNLFETVLQLTGMTKPALQRASLSRFWSAGGESAGADDAVISELSPESVARTQISYITSQWQYLHDAEGGEELYDLIHDAGETTNLAGAPGSEKVLAELQTRMRTAVTESLPPWNGPEYLSALSGSQRILISAPSSKGTLAANPAFAPQLPIGTSQALFPRRAFNPIHQPTAADQELLHSLPYH